MNARLGQQGKSYLLGLVLTAIIALCSFYVGQLPWMSEHGLSALVIAIVIGLFIGNTVYPSLQQSHAQGVQFSKQKLLRLGIILYGFRITFQDIGQLGWGAIIVDLIMLISTFLITLYLGMKWLKLDRITTILIGTGSSICGVAAIMSASSVVKSKSEQVTIAVATVVVFGTLAIVVYPEIYYWCSQFSHMGTAQHFGIYIGSTVHEVAQVVAVGRTISDATSNYAVMTKMVRVMLLVPFLLLLSAWMQRSAKKSSDDMGERTRIAIPWFAFGFIVVAAFNSVITLPAEVIQVINNVDTFVLAMAMAALGLTTHVSVIKKAGIKPLILAGIMFVWLVFGGLMINHIVLRFFA